MKAEETGAGATRPPGTPAGSGRMNRLALASAGVPFRLKVAIVWVVIFAILGFFFHLAGFDTGWILDKIPYIAGGLRYTIMIALGGIVLAIVLALLGALGRLSRNPIAYGVTGFYTSFFRGTPLIVQLFLIYLALPQIGVNLSARLPWIPSGLTGMFTLESTVAGILGLGLNYGAYMSEIFRAGIQSVGHGQGEAAEALGMTYRQKMWRIVLPQAFRVIVPPTGNEFIAMMKDTALVSFLGTTVAAMEIFRRSQLVGKHYYKNLEAYIAAAVLYWILTAIFSYFQGRLERRLSKGYVRAAGPERKARFVHGSGGAGSGAMMVEVPMPDTPDEERPDG
jgi:polar amino acid transport system permease protein